MSDHVMTSDRITTGILWRCVALLCLMSTLVKAQESNSSWTCFGGAEPNLNYRKAIPQNAINASNAQSLQVLFSVNTSHADVSATPTVLNGTIFFPDWAGYLWAVDSKNGNVKWKVEVGSYLPNITGTAVVSRTTPALDEQSGLLVIGTQVAEFAPDAINTAYVLGIYMDNGTLAWKYNASYHPYAVITGSASIYQGRVYTGVSSLEEFANGYIPGYQCCTFRGSVLSLQLHDGQLVWQTFTQPDNNATAGGFAGGSVWGSAPAIDTQRRQVYIATGNNYAAPDSVVQCINSSKTNQEKAKCQAKPGNWFNSILALNMDDGHIVWGQRMSYFDVWTLACFPGLPSPQPCLVPESGDFDFGHHPLFFPNHSCTINGTNTTQDLVIGFQKSGYVHALSASATNNDSRVVWSTYTGAGGNEGGSEWGSASDGVSTVFAQNSNSLNTTVNLTRPAPGSPSTTKTAFFTAIDICSGDIKWQAVNPDGSVAKGPPAYSGSIQEGVVFYPTMAAEGYVQIIRAADGTSLGNVSVGASTISGPSIVDGIMYVGAGYSRLGGTAGTQVVAFSVPSNSSSNATDPAA